MLDIEYDLFVYIGLQPDPLRESSTILYWHSTLSRDLKEKREKEQTDKQKRPTMKRR